MEPTYENIKPLIKSKRQEGMHLVVLFQAENQKVPIQSFGIVVPEQKNIMANVGKQAAKSAVKNSLISSISRFFGSFFGGVAGSAVRSATSQVAHDMTNQQVDASQLMNVKLTPEKEEQAVLMAFHTAQQYFKWDAENNKWMGQD